MTETGLEQTEDRQYLDALGGGAGGALDLYFAEEASQDRPIVVFHHIRKTAGTSLRHLIYSNKGHASYEPRRGAPKGRPERVAWYAELYESLGDRRRKLVCAAGHSANHLIPLMRGRPIVALTLLRDPVDRVESRYYFYTRERKWTLEGVYGLRGGAPMRNLSMFFNGQAQSLLEPHYKVGARSLPMLGSHPRAEMWRERLFELVDRYYLVGLQDRFFPSVELFAERLEWTTLYPAAVRINPLRPPTHLDSEVVEAVRRYNWLDEELYLHAVQHFDRNAAA